MGIFTTASVRVHKAVGCIFAGLMLSGTAVASESGLSLADILRPVATPSRTVGSEANDATTHQKTAIPVRLTLDSLMASLAEDLTADLPQGEQIELKSRADWRPIIINGDADWQVYTGDVFRPDPRGNWFPLVVLEVDDEVVGSWRLPIKVALYRQVHMAYTRLHRGDRPVAPAVRSVVKNIYSERGSPIPATEDLSDFELVQPVAEGRLLSWNDVMQKPSVRRGELVEVNFNDGVLAISMTGMSLQDGVIGEHITVRNTRSRQEFTGKVTGPGRVELNARNLQ